MNELQKIFDNTPVESYQEKITVVVDYLASIADGENIVGDGKSVVYPDFWEYKHSFAEKMYIREMRMKKGQIGVSVIQKYSYPFFVLTGNLAVTTESGVEEFVGPVYFTSPPGGAQRIVYAVEDCVITTVHANPTNTQDLKEIEQNNVVFSWEEYEEYMKNKK